MLLPTFLKWVTFRRRNFFLTVATLFILAAVPLTVLLTQEAREPASHASTPSFSITSVSQINQEINPNFSTVDVCGADLGSMFDWSGKTYLAFGDSFGCPLNPSQPNWRSNTLAFTTDTTPSNGITITSWITGSDGKAKELIPNDPVSSTETAIPTNGVSEGTTGYLYYFEGQISPSWTCQYSSVAKSTDSGQNWTKLTALKWNPGNFNQVAIYKKDGYVYFFGIPCGRTGGVKLMRVSDGSIENKALYQYLSNVDGSGNPAWITNNEAVATTIIAAPVGELSVRYDSYLNQYIMMYLKDVAPYTIELRSSPSLWGPWSTPQTVTTGNTYSCLYAPFMKEGYEENAGQTVYFRMSRLCPGFNPYSTYWMKMVLQVAAPPTPAPTVDLKVNGGNGPVTIASGLSAALSWTSTNAISCSASGGWSGNMASSGSVSTGVLTSTKTYTLTCVGAGGVSSPDSVTVNLTPASTSNPPPSPGTATPPTSGSTSTTPSTGKSSTTGTTSSGNQSPAASSDSPSSVVAVPLQASSTTVATAGSISIKITTSDGAPLEGAVVTLLGVKAPTDATGIVTFLNVVPGTYKITIAYKGAKIEKTIAFKEGSQNFQEKIAGLDFVPFQYAFYFFIFIFLLLITKSVFILVKIKKAKKV